MAFQRHCRDVDVPHKAVVNCDALCSTFSDALRFVHLDIHTFYKYYKRIVAGIGRPDARVHDLRHTAATVMIASGADIKSVQDFMGHATASFILNVYAHTSEQMMKDTAARAQSYYDKVLKKA